LSVGYKQSNSRYMIAKMTIDTLKTMTVSLSPRRSVAIQDIAYLEGLRNYTKVVLHQGRPIIVTLTLSVVLENITSDSFLRLSKTYAIHTDLLGSLDYDGHNALRLPNGQELTISRRRLRMIRREKNIFRKKGLQKCA